MKQYLLDTSVLLDLLLNRTPWAADAATIWDAHRNGSLKASVAAFAIPAIFYIARKQAGIAAARLAVDACLSTLEIVWTDRTTLLAAYGLSGTDFEDDLQIACAVQSSADAIITRDPKGFSASPVTILSPADVVASLSSSTTP